jgi:hypothetical protein
MTELLNFPVKNQLADGDENAQFDCVPASLAASLEWLLHIPFSSAELKDAVYGDGYVGGTAASAYVDLIKRNYGVDLFNIEAGTNENAVRQAHLLIQRGYPVIFTQQDDYAPPGAIDWTHVCVWYAEAPGTLTAMDPFGGKRLTYSDAAWTSRLRSPELWTVEKAMLDVSHPAVAGFFKVLAPDMWQCKHNGYVIGHAILDFYRSFGRTDFFGLSFLGLPLSNEYGVGNGCVEQKFERALLRYDPSRKKDAPPGVRGPVYLAHIDALYQTSVVPAPDVAKELAALQGRVAQAIKLLQGN